jgi:predicted phosphodiesterase
MNLFDLLIKRKIPGKIYDFDKKIIHITDTPDVVFPYLRRLIKIINPDIIIHTGDLVDNIKLEFSRSDIINYEKRVKSLIKILKSVSPEKIIIAIGNHDDKDIIKKYLDEDDILEEKIIINIDEKRYLISHRYEACTEKNIDYFLYGHDLSKMSDLYDKPIYLNGLAYIYIIDALSGEIGKIPYPKDTDDFRMKKFKMGF